MTVFMFLWQSPFGIEGPSFICGSSVKYIYLSFQIFPMDIFLYKEFVLQFSKLALEKQKNIYY